MSTDDYLTAKASVSRKKIFAYNREESAAVVDVMFRLDTTVPFTNVQTMVYGIFATLGQSGIIGALHIIDHGVGAGSPEQKEVTLWVGQGKNRHRTTSLSTTGSGTGIAHIGSDELTVSTLARHAPLLKRLTPRFAPDGWIYLHNCYVGRDRDLVRKLAGVMQRPVIASTEQVKAVIGLTLGVTTTAYPDGRVVVGTLPLNLFW